MGLNYHLYDVEVYLKYMRLKLFDWEYGTMILVIVEAHTVACRRCFVALWLTPEDLQTSSKTHRCRTRLRRAVQKMNFKPGIGLGCLLPS